MSKKKKAKRRESGRNTIAPVMPVVPAADASGLRLAGSDNAIEESQPAPAQSSAVRSEKSGNQSSDPRWRYVAGDMRKVFVLASLCVAAELALWYLLSSTPAGTAIYNLINI